jgi:hypothetical protein
VGWYTTGADISHADMPIQRKVRGGQAEGRVLGGSRPTHLTLLTGEWRQSSSTGQSCMGADLLPVHDVAVLLSVLLRLPVPLQLMEINGVPRPLLHCFSLPCVYCLYCPLYCS